MTHMKKYFFLVSCITVASASISAWQNSNQRLASRSVMTPEILQTVRKLRCEIDSGSLTIRGVDRDYSCRYVAHNTDPEATVSVVLIGDELVVTFKKNRKNEFKKNLNRAKRRVKHFFERVIFGDVCREIGTETYNAHVDFELYLPHEIVAEIALGAGLINIDGIDKDIYVDAGSACIRAHNIMSHIYLSIGHAQEIDLSYKDAPLGEPKTCELKGGSTTAFIDIPSRFCVKSTLSGSLYATRIRNQFNPCREHPDIWITGHVGSGTVDIVQK